MFINPGFSVGMWGRACILQVFWKGEILTPSELPTAMGRLFLITAVPPCEAIYCTLSDIYRVTSCMNLPFAKSDYLYWQATTLTGNGMDPSKPCNIICGISDGGAQEILGWLEWGGATANPAMRPQCPPLPDASL